MKFTSLLAVIALTSSTVKCMRFVDMSAAQSNAANQEEPIPKSTPSERRAEIEEAIKENERQEDLKLRALISQEEREEAEKLDARIKA